MRTGSIPLSHGVFLQNVFNISREHPLSVLPRTWDFAFKSQAALERRKVLSPILPLSVVISRTQVCRKIIFFCISVKCLICAYSP